MRKLIISWSTYDWIFHCLGVVIKEPKAFDVMVICRDDTTPIYNCRGLCKDAIYAQRRHDLFRIGKELGIRKIMNMNFDEEENDLMKLITQLQLHISLGGVGELYYYNSFILSKIINEIANKFGVKAYSYGTNTASSEVKVVLLGEEEKKRIEILNLCIGRPVNVSNYRIMKTDGDINA